MKKYILSLISFIISFGCIVAYNIIGSKVAEDGTLIEPFFLIPMAWLFVAIAVLSGVVIFVSASFRKH